MIYAFPCHVTAVFERLVRKHVSGSGEASVFSTASIGWYIQFDNMTSIYVGDEKPAWNEGDKIELILRKP